MDTPADTTEQSWGARVNTGNDAALVELCPSWATPAQQHLWAGLGFVWWDNTVQLIIHLAPIAALDLLIRLRTSDAWQTHGLILGDPVFMLPESPRSRTRRHPETLQSDVPSPARKAEIHLDDPVQLPATQARTLFQALESHEAALGALAEPTLRRQNDALAAAQKYLIGAVELQQARKVDLSTRPLPWIHDPVQQAWICDHGLNRVTVCLADAWLGWRGCLERPHQLKHDSRYCATFEAALAWGEHALFEEVERPPSDPPAPIQHTRLSPATLTVAHRKRLKRYWIDPRALEPAHPTYRVVIALEHGPIRREYREVSFDEKVVWHEQFAPPTDLPRLVGLHGHAMVSMHAGGYYSLAALATYADAATARERATALWERSTIAAAFQTGDVIWAKYGIEEVETTYHWWIGGYGAWHTPPLDRDAFLTQRAFVLTLLHALDVAGYRAALALFGPEHTHEDILHAMHERRMESLGIPAAARAESAQWLREHHRSGHQPNPSGVQRSRKGASV